MLIIPDEPEASEIAAIMINALVRDPCEWSSRMRRRGMARYFFLKGQNQNIIPKINSFFSSYSTDGNVKLKVVFIMCGGEFEIRQLQEIIDTLNSFDGIVSDDMVWSAGVFYTESIVSVLGIFF